ncbi:HEAT repeat domain-containing protein [Micromonospora wenchangensis]|uniref:HEAT repeat domain-containing protein n=1 Tax=Micromonospora wenchangensis TaxID=1185415 RepID=UPI0038011E23
MTGSAADTDRTRGLAGDDPSVRLRVALALGTAPDPRDVDPLVARCAVEPDFAVREMLTWALTRHPAAVTVPRLVAALGTPSAQARSQALHTLSKIGDSSAWPALTPALLTDADDEVARAAWRAAVVLVPHDAEAGLARILATQFGRGDRGTWLSLARALAALGEVATPVLDAAASHPDPPVRAHAAATRQLMRDPDAGFAFSVEEAKRVVALGDVDRQG